MEELITCKLCAEIPPGELDEIKRHTLPWIRNFGREEIIALEGDECNSLGVVLEGSVSIQRLLPSGNRVVMDLLSPGDSFGEVIIFSDVQVYPASIMAGEHARIAFLSREEVIRLCQVSPGFLKNFMKLLSNKIWILNRKVKSLSYTSVRQKTVNFLLEAYTQQRSAVLHFDLSRREMAEHLNLPRPSLSRELAALKAEGWIDYGTDTIWLLKISCLEDCLVEG